MKINISGNWSLLLFIVMILLSRENGLHARLKTPPTLKTTHPTTASVRLQLSVLNFGP